MYVQVEKTKGIKNRAVANLVVQKKAGGKQGFNFVDNRNESILQQKTIEFGMNNKQVTQLNTISDYTARDTVQLWRTRKNNEETKEIANLAQLNEGREGDAIITLADVRQRVQENYPDQNLDLINEVFLNSVIDEYNGRLVKHGNYITPKEDILAQLAEDCSDEITEREGAGEQEFQYAEDKTFDINTNGWSYHLVVPAAVLNELLEKGATRENIDSIEYSAAVGQGPGTWNKVKPGPNNSFELKVRGPANSGLGGGRYIVNKPGGQPRAVTLTLNNWVAQHN